jgi:hypothetical protein
MDGTDINAVDRSRMAYEKQMRLLASGNDRGQVVVFEYPCLEKSNDLGYRRFRGGNWKRPFQSCDQCEVHGGR